MRNDFETGYLEHWGLKKGAKKENHKYVERIELSNGKYRYFYSQLEYDAYLKSKEIREKTAKALEYASKKVNETVKKGQDFIDKKQQEASKKSWDRAVNKLKKKDVKNVPSSSEEIKKKTTAFAKDIQDKAEKTTSGLIQKLKNQEATRQAYRERQEKARIKNNERLAAEKKAKAEKEKQDTADRKAYKEKLEEIRRNAKNIFCKDAKDSFKEDHTKHPNIKVKERAMSKDDDMAIVNKNRSDYVNYINSLYDAYHKEKNSKRKAEIERQYNEAVKNYNAENVNCASCSVTYDLRRRGYDVVAPKQMTGGLSTEDLLKVYKPKNQIKTVDNIFIKDKYEDFDWNDVSHLKQKYLEEAYDMKIYNASQIKSGRKSNTYYPFSSSETREIIQDIKSNNPEGSYGYLNVSWETGGGHSVIWSIESGQVILRDCQTNEKCAPEEYLDASISCTIFRADNLELSDTGYEYATAIEMDREKVKKKKG